MFKFFRVNKDNEFQELEEDNTSDLELEAENEEIWQVAVDILETPREIIILSPVAWIEFEDIDLSFHDQVLSIRWERLQPEIYTSNVIVKNKECYWGKFVRNIILPENLDFDDIKASIENNLLVITIPKLQFPGHNIKIEKV